MPLYSHHVDQFWFAFIPLTTVRVNNKKCVVIYPFCATESSKVELHFGNVLFPESKVLIVRSLAEVLLFLAHQKTLGTRWKVSFAAFASSSSRWLRATPANKAFALIASISLSFCLSCPSNSVTFVLSCSIRFLLHIFPSSTLRVSGTLSEVKFLVRFWSNKKPKLLTFLSW